MGVSFGMRWKGVFCFFMNLEALGVGEDECLRFLVVVVGAGWSGGVEESEAEVVERLGLAEVGF